MGTGMKTLIRMLLFLILFIPETVMGEEESGQHILQKNYLANRLIDSKAEITMLLRNSRGKERTRRLYIYTQQVEGGDDNKYALFFKSPADIKGTATLLIQVADSDDDMWVYLPALRKTRRLYSDNKRDSFFGSELSYGDIIGHRPVDWTARLIGKDTIDGKNVLIVEALPVSDLIMEESGYSKRVLYIDNDSYLALKTEYWDDLEQPLKEVVIGGIKKLDIDGKYQFISINALNLQSNNTTDITYNLFEYDIGLQDSFFTERSLKKGLGLR